MRTINIWFIFMMTTMFFSSCQRDIYLFTSFHEPANEGLRYLYSEDAYHWKPIRGIYLKPELGAQKIMRDPSMLQDKHGIYHLVWTIGWKGNEGIGYARSTDLIHWDNQKIIPVMKHEPTTVNVWAPELFYDDVNSRFIIIWASTIPHRFPKGKEAEDNNHRMYYTTTKDFNTFTETQLFSDPGFSMIDAVIVKKAKQDYVLVLKDNTRPNRDLRVAFATNPLGPFQEVSKPFSAHLTEGPTVVKVKDEWLIYFDSYGSKRYEAVATKDFKTFKSINDRISVPEGHKHGTIFRSSKKVLKNLRRHEADTK
ncbi:glycoside hydrolase family 43 protein [Sphingobacterium thalpophilum]|uniref:Beta-xylosidase n=1 Tax=Sphingobacterium thalpophilum TaxID=259 RepID=A0A4U9V7F8_9SPHI|nr:MULTISPECIES: glycoside hydrolase family 43 protein [Sphingobacterium]MCW8312271.1 glycoside hydrolase family 43 protein [Sphingobacterium sp. InxBP1]VTR38894.1 Beta-xylosidase [Sphingobacterium thalpophilum]